MIARRTFLQLLLGVPALAAEPADLAWAVGVPGGYLADYVRAKTEGEAIARFLKHWSCVAPGEAVVAVHVPAWDNRTTEPSGRDWELQGFGALCASGFCDCDGFDLSHCYCSGERNIPRTRRVCGASTPSLTLYEAI
jgi:hypothetical protein